MRVLFLSCLCCSAIALFSQKQPDCLEMLNQARTFERQNELSKAVQSYLNALNCNSTLGNEIGPRLKSVFEKIEAQKDSEQKAKQVAEERLVSIQKQAKEIQAQTMARQANSLMTEGRFYEAMDIADQANELVPSGDMQALMMRAYEALQQRGTCRLTKSFTSGLKKISQLFYNHNTGVIVATDRESGASVLYHLSQNEIIEAPLPGIITNVIFSPDDQRFVVVNHKSEMTLWDGDCKKIADIPILFFDESCKIEFSPCSQYLLYENRFSGKLWSANGLILVDGADTLRPLFTEAFYNPWQKDKGGANFYTLNNQTFILTHNRSEDTTLWDISLLLQGHQKKSIVKMTFDLRPNGLKDNILVSKPAFPDHITLITSPNFPLKYLTLDTAAGSTKPLAYIKRDHSIVAYTPDRRSGMLATATENGEIALWQFNWSFGFEKRFKGKSVARFDPQGNRVLVLESPFKLHLLDLQGNNLFRQPVYHYPLMPLLNGELFDAGGKLLLTYFGRTWSVHDMEGSLLYAHQSSESYTWPVFSHDCKHILHGSGSGLYKTDIDKYATNCIFRSDTTIQNPINTLAENFVRLRTADGKSVLVREDGIQVRDLPWLSKKGYFSPAKYFFIEKMEDTTVALYTVLGKQVIFPEQIKGIDFSMDDQFLIVHLKSGKSEVRTREGRILKLTRQRVDGVFSPSGRYVLLYNELEATIELLGLKKATILNISPKGKLLSCAFSPDEEYVACAFENQVVEIVKTTGEPVLTIAEIGSVRFSPAGNYLLVLKNNDVKIYNRDGLQIEKIESGDTVTNFEFSMDDRWLVVSDYNGTVKVIPSPLGIHHYFTANAPSPAASDKYNRN